MKTRTIILTIAAAAAIALPAALMAQGVPGMGPGGGPGHHHGPGGGFADDGPGFFEHMLPRLTERLGLSEEQTERIESILDAARPTIEGYAEQLRAGRDAYREANPDPTVFDEAAFRAHAAEQSRIQVELMVAAQRTKALVLAELTPEQLAQFEEMRSEGGKRLMRRPGGRHSN